MNLASMRTKFQQLTSGLADDWDEAEIDAYLDYVYSEFLPADIDGRLHQVRWVTTLTINQNPITIPDHIVSFPSGIFFLQGTNGTLTGTLYRLVFYDDLVSFYNDFPDHLDPAVVGRPTALYREGKSIWFDVIPDDDYNLIANARGAQASALTANGLPFNHAMAVCSGAAWNFLLEQEDEVAVARVANIYDTYKGRLLTESGSDFRGRSPNRSF